jgi:hypothetical protein
MNVLFKSVHVFDLDGDEGLPPAAEVGRDAARWLPAYRAMLAKAATYSVGMNRRAGDYTVSN